MCIFGPAWEQPRMLLPQNMYSKLQIMLIEFSFHHFLFYVFVSYPPPLPPNSLQSLPDMTSSCLKKTAFNRAFVDYFLHRSYSPSHLPSAPSPVCYSSNDIYSAPIVFCARWLLWKQLVWCLEHGGYSLMFVSFSIDIDLHMNLSIPVLISSSKIDML